MRPAESFLELASIFRINWREFDVAIWFEFRFSTVYVWFRVEDLPECYKRAGSWDLIKVFDFKASRLRSK
ncbi:hypothetical protein FGF1_19700 [Flavobacteriaceae bacterium GF1]